MRTGSPALRKRACRSGTRSRSTKFCSATVATGSPGRMTVPVVTGIFSTRPAVGANTLPSVTCCSTTERSAVRALQRIGRDIEGRARFIESCLRNGALREQIFGAREIGLRLGHLRFQAGDLCIQRLHLQHELVVADDADDLALADVIALS